MTPRIVELDQLPNRHAQTDLCGKGLGLNAKPLLPDLRRTRLTLRVYELTQVIQLSKKLGYGWVVPLKRYNIPLAYTLFSLSFRLVQTAQEWSARGLGKNGGIPFLPELSCCLW